MDEYVFKMVLIGDKMVGKTSLIRRFVHDQFEGRYMGTIGLNVSTKDLQITVDEVHYRVSLVIYDIEAEATFEDLFGPFAQGSVAAIIVFDLSRESTLESIDDWVRRLKVVTKSSTVENTVLIGNKKDLVSQREIRPEDAELVAKRHSMAGYIEASAKENDQVGESFQLLTEKILRQALPY